MSLLLISFISFLGEVFRTLDLRSTKKYFNYVKCRCKVKSQITRDSLGNHSLGVFAGFSQSC